MFVFFLIYILRQIFKKDGPFQTTWWPRASVSGKSQGITRLVSLLKSHCHARSEKQLYSGVPHYFSWREMGHHLVLWVSRMTSWVGSGECKGLCMVAEKALLQVSRTRQLLGAVALRANGVSRELHWPPAFNRPCWFTSPHSKANWSWYSMQATRNTLDIAFVNSFDNHTPGRFEAAWMGEMGAVLQITWGMWS